MVRKEVDKTLTIKITSLSEEKNGPKWAISLVLSWTIITLGSLPEKTDEQPLTFSYLALHRAGFSRPVSHLTAGELLPRHFNLAVLILRYVFCCTFLWVTPTELTLSALLCGARTFLESYLPRSSAHLRPFLFYLRSMKKSMIQRYYCFRELVVEIA